MKVIRFKLTDLYGDPCITKLEGEIVDLPLLQIYKDNLLFVSGTMEVGEKLSSGDINLNFSDSFTENFIKLKSRFLPTVSFEYHKDNNKRLRMFGTIDFIESLDPAQFQLRELGIKAYIQLLLTTNFITSTAEFSKHLLPLAKKVLNKWDRESINRFSAKVLGKKDTNISHKDIANVVSTITGKIIDLETNKYDISNFVNDLSITEAAKQKPDEFFCAAFPGDFLEVAHLASLLHLADDGYMYIKSTQVAREPISLVCPYTSVNWRISVSSKKEYDYVNAGPIYTEHVALSPMAGTLYSRAKNSILKLFERPEDSEVNIPFELTYEEFNKFVKESNIQYKDFTTGIKYTTSIPELEIFRLGLSTVELEKVADALNRESYIMMSTNDEAEIIKNLIKVYAKNEQDLDIAFADRHFLIVNNDKLKKIKSTNSHLHHRFTSSDNITYPISVSAKDKLVKDIIMYAYILKHTSGDALFYAKAANDDFDKESLFEYILGLIKEPNKDNSIYLVNCYSSTNLCKEKKTDIEVTNLESAFNLGV